MYTTKIDFIFIQEIFQERYINHMILKKESKDFNLEIIQVQKATWSTRKIESKISSLVTEISKNKQQKNDFNFYNRINV